MKCLSLGLVMLCAAGCSQMIADKVLIPRCNPDRIARLQKEGKEIEDRWGSRAAGFAYRTFDGARIKAMMFKPEKQPRGVIVVLHGLTDRKEAMYPIAESFARAGYLAVTPDLRAHGESGGRYTTLGDRERRDQMALLNHLQSEGHDVSHSGVLGGSLGAAVAIQWAAIDPRVKAIVAVAPFADLRSEVEFLSKRRGFAPWLVRIAENAAQEAGQFKVDAVSPVACLKVMDTPLYLAHGFADHIIPQSDSERLFEAARGPVVFQKTCSGHADIRRALGDRFVLRAVDWMDMYVAENKKAGKIPSWVSNYGSRNVLSGPSVATTE